MSLDPSSSQILDSFKAQLQKDLNTLIENHNKEMESQKEKMKIERDALTAQFKEELNELRSKHQEELLKAEETQKKKLESIHEVLKLQLNTLSNLSNNEDGEVNHDDNINKTEHDDNNGRENENIDNIDNEDNANSDSPIDQMIKNKFKELDEIDREMSELPAQSRDPQQYQKLLLINKRQYRILKDLAVGMKKKVSQSTQELNSQLVQINEVYNKQFSQYQWFQKKQADLNEKV